MTDWSDQANEPRNTFSGRFLLWLALAALLTAADQYVKHLVETLFRFGEIRPVTGFFNLVLVGNTGSAFSFLGDAGGWQIWFFSILAVAVTIGIGVMLYKHADKTLFSLSLALVAAGAVGNLIDRVCLGMVIDFLDFHAFGWHWPAFNLADIWICTGAAGIVLDEFLKTRQKP